MYCYFSVASKGSLGVRTQRTSISLTGPLFPIGIGNLICIYFFVMVRQMGIKGIKVSDAPPLIGQERSRNMPTPLQH